MSAVERPQSFAKSLLTEIDVYRASCDEYAIFFICLLIIFIVFNSWLNRYDLWTFA